MPKEAKSRQRKNSTMKRKTEERKNYAGRKEEKSLCGFSWYTYL